MYIAKLQYQDKETALADLISKGVYIESEDRLSYGQGIHSIVEIGVLILENGEYDNEGNVTKEPLFAEGYHFDIMSELEIKFENEIKVNNPKHTFAGYENKLDVTLIETE